MKAKAFLALLLLLLLAACEKSVEVDLSEVPSNVIGQGVGLMPTHCLTCHGVGEYDMDEMLAPPLWGVRAHYLAEFPTPDQFVSAMTEFIVNPHAEKSLMPLEVERHGLKAPVSLSEAEIRSIGSAIYAGEVERPVWSREYRKRHRDCEAIW